MAEETLYRGFTAQQVQYFSDKLGYGLPVYDPNTTTTVEQEQLIQQFDIFQKSFLTGFTVLQLQQMGCWNKENAKPGNLIKENGIHSLYTKDKWVTEPPGAEIGHGVSGTYTFSNPLISAALRPSLVLATLLLMNETMLPWLDGLLNSEWSTIDANDTVTGNTAISAVGCFRSREGQEIAASYQASQSILQDMSDYVLWKIVLPSFTEWSNYPRKPLGSTRRYVVAGRDHSNSLININSDIIEPLLRNNLTESERLLTQFHITVTLVHEIMHVAGRYSAELQGLEDVSMGQGTEPFFEDESIAELGRSWENACFGGAITTMHGNIEDITSPIQHAFRRPHFGLFASRWPNWISFVDGQGTSGTSVSHRHHEKFGAGAEVTMWPVAIDHLEKIQQQDYWGSHVQKYRSQAFVPPKRVGVVGVKGAGHYYIYGDDIKDWLQSNYEITWDETVPKNPEEMIAWIPQQVRKIKKEATIRALAAQRDAVAAAGSSANQESLKNFELDQLENVL